eukprot:1157096-Pelagomonas_calceolata.AAC.9
MAKTSKHTTGSFMASAHWIKQFVCKHALWDRLHVPLWLRKTFLIPAGMYASHVWGTEYVKEGQEFSSELQVRHTSFLKDTLGVKRATTNWAVFREYGDVPLQFYWFKSAIKMYNGLLHANYETLRSWMAFKDCGAVASGSASTSHAKCQPIQVESSILRLGGMDVLFCAIGAHADKFKMRSMSCLCEGMRGNLSCGNNFKLAKLFSFVSELMDIMLAGEDQSQADQPNSPAEGPPV